MCSFCEPHGWDKKCCCICGSGSSAYISISIATGHADNLYPYTQTDLCRNCWDKYGINPAIDHNSVCKEDSDG